jgi:flagellar assembly protein FliH
MSSRRVIGAAALEASRIAWPESGDPVRGDGKSGSSPAQRAEAETRLELDAAREEGRRQGELEARQRLEARHNSEWEKLARTVEEVASHKARLRRETEAEVVRLAVNVARRILRRELTVDPGAIEGLVKAAFERVSTREVTKVRVAPAGRMLLDQMLARIGPATAIAVESDPSLEAGGILIETPRGTLDASVEGQLSEIERGFADLLGGTQ